jgi:hypothetical protein
LKNTEFPVLRFAEIRRYVEFRRETQMSLQFVEHVVQGSLSMP